MSKGQVTVFIILAIVIIAIVGAAFYFRNQLIRSSFQSEREKAALVPEQIRPVKLFADRCVEDAASQAVDILGFQGGYISLPEDELPITNVNPFSNKLKLSSRSAASVAYWSYQKANGVRTRQIPSQEDMENSIAGYIALNVNNCFDGFYEFNDDGFNITRGFLGNVDVRILDNTVEVIVEQPVNVNFKNIDFTINKHFAEVSKPLGLFYDVANQVYDEEEASYFLEDKTIDMLVVYDELPYSDTDFNCRPRIWTKSQVEKDFRNIVAGNIAALRVEGSSFRLDEENGYFVVDALDGKQKDIGLSFIYSPNWPTKVEIEPSDGELIKGESINQDIGNDLEGFLTSLFCINNYHFIYDISYPVLVAVSNDDYTFQYALQVSIDNNQPRENLLGEEEAVKAVSEICEAKTGARIIINTLTETPDGRLLPVDDVDVSYKCITASCQIASSKNGRIEASFPACLNGVAIGKKDGYVVGKTLVSSNEDVETSLIVRPLYTRKIDVMLIDKDTGEVRKPFESEQVVFEFKNDAYSTSIVWPDSKEIILAPGSYDVKSYVIGESTWDIMIAEREIENCVEVPNGFLGIFGSTRKDCKNVKIPGMTLEEVVKGGGSFTFDARHSELASSSRLILYTMVDDIPGTYESLTNVYDEIDSSIIDNRFRYPRFE